VVGSGSGEVAIEPLGRPLGTGGIDLAPVEAGPFLRVAEEIVGSRHSLELLFSLPVAGIEIGMKLLCEAPVGLLDLLGGGARLCSEHVIRIVAQRLLLQLHGPCWDKEKSAVAVAVKSPRT
jgi:hypothetical protein